MNDNIRSLPNGDFEVVPKRKGINISEKVREETLDNIFNQKPPNCPKCIAPNFPYQMSCVCAIPTQIKDTELLKGKVFKSFRVYAPYLAIHFEDNTFALFITTSGHFMMFEYEDYWQNIDSLYDAYQLDIFSEEEYNRRNNEKRMNLTEIKMKSEYDNYIRLKKKFENG